MINYDLSALNTILDCLMNNDISIMVDQNIHIINVVAMKIYNIADNEMSDENVEELKTIILICNIMYNRTDLTVLPIEDGFYDLLLEKYKRFDPNFQVGSYLSNFGTLNSDVVNMEEKEIICPIEFFEEPKRDELRQGIYNDIMREGKPILNTKDIHIVPVEFDAPYISKRTHNIEHNHPTLIGTLDKAKFVMIQDAIDAGVINDPNVSVLERDFFMDHISKGIYSPNREINVVCELKYDGISVEADCNFTVQSARSRGDTGVGAASDMTPILKDYIFKQANCMIGEPPIGVKFEAIMTKSNLYKFNEIRGKKYANCRTAIIGLFGASDAYLFKDFITLVPLAIDMEQFNQLHPDTPIQNRIQEIDFINKVFVSHGEPLRYCYFSGTVAEVLYLIKLFVDEAKYCRDHLNFMYDGVVVSILDEDIRAALGRKNFINKFSMAVKFDPLEKQTTFRGYTYEIGQHGNIVPMIHYDPVEFNGSIHTKSTGSSLNRFRELNLKIGDIINVTYVNDVMPYVSRIDCSHNRENPNPPVQIISKCPVCNSDLVVSKSGKTLLCPNNSCPARTLQRMTNMFAKLNIKGFAEATFTALGKSNLKSIAAMTREEMIEKLGEADGNSLYDCMKGLMTNPINDYMIMGALGFTSIARKKWADILTSITVRQLLDTWKHCFKEAQGNMSLCTSKFEYILSQIPKAGKAAVATISEEFVYYVDDIEFIVNNMNLIDSYGTTNSDKVQIRFSGFRNSQLVEQLITAGYDADDNASITKNTNILLIPYSGFTSTKTMKAAKNPNTMILTVDEFKERFSIN